MTTKYKIVTGFLLMVVLVAALALVGERGLSRATSNFAAYDRISKLNVLLSDMYREVYATAYNIENFMQVYNPGLIDTAKARLDSAISLGAEAATIIQMEERKASMNASLNELRQYKGFADTIRTNVVEAQRLYREVFLATAAALGDELSTINTNGRLRNNVDAMYVAHVMREGMMRMQIAFATYMEVLSPEQEKIAEEALIDATGRLKDLDAVMTSDLGRRDFARISKAFEDLNACFGTLRKLISDAGVLITQTHAINRRVADLVEGLNSDIDREMARTSAETIESNSNARASMLGISGIGMALGILMAAFIIVTLIRVLRRMSAFAEAVARGDFSFDAGIREKGEIGGMVTAMRKIPDTLSDVVARCGIIANDVASGKFTATLPTEGLQGGFRELAQAVNAVGDSYAAVIDTLPVSIMTADAKHIVQYCNATPNALVTPDMVGALYGGKGNDSESVAEAAQLGTRCMQNNASVPAELSVTTPEGRKSYAVIASPLKDLSNKAAGFMEIITDITVIKDQEERMRAVAEQASVISDRVAAAAEELAAQVEQISRGAEMQRERVETTASAMTEMNSTVLEVARNASQASDQSNATRQNAVSGAELVDKMVAAIDDVNRVGTRLQTNMEGLGEQAENIGGVMGVISDIADQTNLLALNAAIEAARAGEAGRGFAVVADEVRKLAEKTMTATQEVGSSIAAVQHSAHLNMEEVAESVRSVTRATELANSSGAALSEIVDLASATSSVVSSIAAAAEQQSAASEEITGAIEEINKVVGETTEGMLQSSEAVQDLSRMAQELRRVMEELR